LFDLDENGYITKGEIQELFGGVNINDDLWTGMISECDDDKDGMISQTEFIKLFKSKIITEQV
jgi:calcium-dependent protein kinase